MTKEEELVNILINKNYHITFAESATGGMLAARLVNVSNASKVLNESFVTYADEAKIKYLNVKKETIDKYNVVSEEVAKEMAIGAAKAANSNIAVTTTGVAGPTGGTEKTPVGMVCFGFYINGDVVTKTKYFGNLGRNKVRFEATNYAFEEIIELLK
jgi:PncC family amidohydrolase